eukprot:1421648-Pleurochrysis_carterae.AAC.2
MVAMMAAAAAAAVAVPCATIIWPWVSLQPAVQLFFLLACFRLHPFSRFATILAVSMPDSPFARVQMKLLWLPT